MIITLGILSFYGFRKYAESVKGRHCLATQISSRLFDLNSFQVEILDGLNETDFVVINQNSGKVIFENGRTKKGIKNDYGYCIFELYHRGVKIYEMGHFKYNSWSTNDYLLSINQTYGRIDPTLLVSGENATYADFFYKRFEMNKEGLVEKILYLTKGKKVYNDETLN